MKGTENKWLNMIGSGRGGNKCSNKNSCLQDNNAGANYMDGTFIDNN